MSTRPAILSDIPTIASLVDVHARRGGVLPRSAAEIQNTLAGWVVAEDEQRVVACGMLAQYTPWLAEIRSLVVDDCVKANGWGSAIVRALIEQARQREIAVVFALTRAVPFFLHLDFVVCSLADFPEKARQDCQRCPLLDCCDETAVALRVCDPPAGTPLPVRCPPALVGRPASDGATGEPKGISDSQ